MVPANSNRASPTPSYSGYPPYSFFYPYAALTLYGRPSQTFQVLARVIMQVLLPRTCRNTRGLGCSVFARHYLRNRSEEHTSELQSLMRISYDVFCFKKKK